MAYEYDRFEREDSGGSFLMGLLAGTVLGAGLGMLFAPKPGSELRTQLSDTAGRLRKTADETYHQASDKVSQMMDRGREAYDRARASGGGAVNQATETINEMNREINRGTGAGTGTGGFSTPGTTQRS